MQFLSRHPGIALAILLASVLALGKGLMVTATPPAAKPLVAAVPVPPAAPTIKPKKRISRKLASKPAAPPAVTAQPRGARLRDKGEALGGGTPDRVDTGTMSIRSAQ